MMTKLREFSTTFLIILVLAFVGMMVFEWGMDYTGMSRGQNNVGEVNGEKLTFEQFSEFYQQLYQNEKERSDAEIDETKLKSLRDQVWDQFVQRTLFSEEMQRLNITVSDSEIVHQIRHYPLEEIKSNPSFQTDGEFDWNKYYQSFSNPDIPWIQVEEFYRQQLPFLKLQNIITSSVRVSESEIEDEFIRTNLTAKVEYLEIAFAKFRKNDEEISDEKLRAYYEEHIEDYQQDEKRKLSYVVFPLTPTTADTNRAMRTFEEIRERVAAGENFNDLADEYSEDPAVKQNHGLYDYFERGAMVKPFEDAAFGGKVGEIVGPVKTTYGYHLIKIEDKRREGGKEQVKASHILITITAGPSTREAMADNAALFAEDASTYGFEQTAEKNDLTVEETTEFQEKGDFVPGFGRNYNIVSFAFRSNLNDVSDYMETEKGFTVFKLSEIIEAGPRPFEEVKAILSNRIRMENAKNNAHAYADSLKSIVYASEDWSKIAESDEKQIVKYDSTSELKYRTSVPKIGYSPEFNSAAFAFQVNEISDVVETNRGLYYLRLLKKSEFDSSLYEQQYTATRQRLLAQKRNKVFNDWYEYLKENADIVDNRKMFNL